jgi:hypothetical protein
MDSLRRLGPFMPSYNMEVISGNFSHSPPGDEYALERIEWLRSF